MIVVVRQAAWSTIMLSLAVAIAAADICDVIGPPAGLYRI
jgi:hypothetical protein